MKWQEAEEGSRSEIEKSVVDGSRGDSDSAHVLRRTVSSIVSPLEREVSQGVGTSSKQRYE